MLWNIIILKLIRLNKVYSCVNIDVDIIYYIVKYDNNGVNVSSTIKLITISANLLWNTFAFVGRDLFSTDIYYKLLLALYLIYISYMINRSVMELIAREWKNLIHNNKILFIVMWFY